MSMNITVQNYISRHSRNVIEQSAMHHQRQAARLAVEAAYYRNKHPQYQVLVRILQEDAAKEAKIARLLITDCAE